MACSPDAADFQEEAEKYIESREFSEDAGLLRFTDAECEEPESTAEDTLYTCTATAEDGSRWQFDVEITGDADLRVIIPPTLLVGGAHRLERSPADSVAGHDRGRRRPPPSAATTTTDDGRRRRPPPTTTDRRPTAGHDRRPLRPSG